MYRLAFRPLCIGNVTLKNRIVMLPMGDGLQDDQRGVSPRQIAYFAARARGGAGLLFQAANPRNNHGLQGWNLDINDAGKVPGMRALTDAVHAHGAKMGVMLGLGFGDVYPNFDGSMPKTPSAMPLVSDPTRQTDPFTTEEIYTLIEQYGQSAALAQQGGYDLVHIQGYGGYLIDLFTCEKWNWREDEFGGSFENRMRFPLELIRSIQRHCGASYPIVYKLAASHLLDGGRTPDEARRMAQLLEQAGVAALHIDVGRYPDTCYELIPPVYHEHRVQQFAHAAALRKHVRIPVYTQGKVGDPGAALRVLAEGQTDLLALGRSFLADPEWPRKLWEGRSEDIRPCICCNEGCLVRIEANKPIGCAVNPRAGRETEYTLDPTNAPKRILVVGAGPGGAAAALTLAQRGHQVELWERGSAIGGGLLPASAPPFKREMRRLVDYYRAQIHKTPAIRLRLNREANAGDILEQAPDAVILAVGARTTRPPIPGLVQALCADDALLGQHPLGAHVVVAGGGFIGSLHLSRCGHRVTLVERGPALLPEHAALHTKAMLLRLLRESTIEIHTSTRLHRVEADAVLLEKEAAQSRLPCDTVVAALGSRPNTSLFDSLRGHVPVHLIGDARAPGKVINAVWQACDVARAL